MEKTTDRMTNVKLKGFARDWGKKALGFVFRAWKQQTDYFSSLWSYLDGYYSKKMMGEVF